MSRPAVVPALAVAVLLALAGCTGAPAAAPTPSTDPVGTASAPAPAPAPDASPDPAESDPAPDPDPDPAPESDPAPDAESDLESDPDPAPGSDPAPDAAPAPGPGWDSGAAGTQVFDGSLAEWRGSEVAVVGTWADTNDAMVALYELQPGGPLHGWAGDMDIAVGAIGPDETWAEAAAGAYDARWAESLRELAGLREGLGTTYVRFAHESNGDWYDWAVDAGSAEDFVTSWRRYRALQLEHMPEAELVFSVNSQSVGSGVDWRETFPGAQHVDLLGVDHYNQYPWVGTVQEWDAAVLERDEWGAPRGLQRHAEFAAEVGLPFSVNEWSNNADMGDSPVFMTRMNEFFASNAGDGPGELVYEVHFNVQEFGDGQFGLYPDTRMPESAAVYRELW